MLARNRCQLEKQAVPVRGATDVSVQAQISARCSSGAEAICAQHMIVGFAASQIFALPLKLASKNLELCVRPNDQQACQLTSGVM